MPGWVEGYIGPSALAHAVDVGEDVSVQELRETALALQDSVGSETREPDRRAWLSAQLSAISAALLSLDGERLSYGELFERCHGAQVELVADRQFERAHALLDRALPGPGNVAARYRRWRDTQLVPQDQLQNGLQLLAGEMRRHCRERFGLPADERVTWQLISGNASAGDANYLGHGETLIKINTDLPISSPRLLELVCHEAYPGHHAEAVCKDASLTKAFGREELLVYVYPTPQAVISEGLASYGLEALLGSEADQIAADSLRPAGIPYDHETASAVRAAETLLLPVRSNIALMLHDGAASLEAHEYARAWLLDDREQIDQAIDRLQARSWRPYESCYPVGLALCHQYATANPNGFHDLLHRQLTPAELARHDAELPPD